MIIRHLDPWSFDLEIFRSQAASLRFLPCFDRASIDWVPPPCYSWIVSIGPYDDP